MNLNALIQKAQNMPPFPESVTRLTALVTDPNSSIQEIEKVILTDGVLCARTIRAANSAFARSSSRIVLVGEALLRIGTGYILSLAMATQVEKYLKEPLPQCNIPPEGLWRHSVAVSLATQILPSFTGASVPPESHAAALLHDIGKLVLLRFLGPEEITLLNKACVENELTPLEAERKTLNIHHGEIGGIVAQHWRLPPGIVEGIMHHHTPELARNKVGHVVCLSNWAAHRSQSNLAENQILLPSEAVTAITHLKFPENKLHEFYQAVKQNLDEVIRHFE